jgi:hypothetical protein
MSSRWSASGAARGSKSSSRSGIAAPPRPDPSLPCRALPDAASVVRIWTRMGELPRLGYLRWERPLPDHQPARLDGSSREPHRAWHGAGSGRRLGAATPLVPARLRTSVAIPYPAVSGAGMTSLAFCRAISAHRRRASCRLPLVLARGAGWLSLPGEEELASAAAAAQTASAACSRRSTLARVSPPVGICVRTASAACAGRPGCRASWGRSRDRGVGVWPREIGPGRGAASTGPSGPRLLGGCPPARAGEAVTDWREVLHPDVVITNRTQNVAKVRL